MLGDMALASKLQGRVEECAHSPRETMQNMSSQAHLRPKGAPLWLVSSGNRGEAGRRERGEDKEAELSPH